MSKTPRQLLVEMAQDTTDEFVVDAYQHLRKNGIEADQALKELTLFIDEIIKIKQERLVK
jgi:hypothetical protein